MAGQVLAVHINDSQPVKAGAPLLEIDPRDYDAKLTEQRGNVEAAETEAHRAAADAKRYEQIFKQDDISQQQLDNAQAAATAAPAALEKERGALQTDELNLSYTNIPLPRPDASRENRSNQALTSRRDKRFWRWSRNKSG